MGNYSKPEQIVYEGKETWLSIIPDILGIYIIIGLFTIIPNIIRVCTNRILITNKRVTGKTGWINTKTLDAPLNKVNNIQVSKSLFGKLFNYGAVEITTSSGSFLFKEIKRPEEVKIALLNQIEEFEQDKMSVQAQIMAQAVAQANAAVLQQAATQNPNIQITQSQDI